MEITLNLTAVTFAILILLAVVITAYIIKTLQRLNRTIDNINELINSNKKEIDLTLKSLPCISSNISDITTYIKSKTDVLEQSLNKEDEIAVSADFETIISGIASIMSIITEVKDAFGGKKRYFRRK